MTHCFSNLLFNLLLYKCEFQVVVYYSEYPYINLQFDIKA